MRKRSNWKRARGWHSHSLACWDAEWAEWQKAAHVSGAKSLNAWIRLSLSEMARYDLMNKEEDSYGGLEPRA